MATTILRKIDDGFNLVKILRPFGKRFKPTENKGPEYDLSLGEKVTEPIDLAKEDGALYAIRGLHRAANYIVQVEGEKIAIWRDTNANGLESNVNNLVSINRQGEYLRIKPGVIVPGRSVALPFFDYEGDKVMSTGKMWVDCAYVWRLK
jgi:hypothetical protein